MNDDPPTAGAVEDLSAQEGYGDGEPFRVARKEPLVKRTMPVGRR